MNKGYSRTKLICFVLIMLFVLWIMNLGVVSCVSFCGLCIMLVEVPFHVGRKGCLWIKIATIVTIPILLLVFIKDGHSEMIVGIIAALSLYSLFELLLLYERERKSILFLRLFDMFFLLSSVLLFFIANPVLVLFQDAEWSDFLLVYGYSFFTFRLRMEWLKDKDKKLKLVTVLTYMIPELFLYFYYDVYIFFAIGNFPSVVKQVGDSNRYLWHYIWMVLLYLVIRTDIELITLAGKQRKRIT